MGSGKFDVESNPVMAWSRGGDSHMKQTGMLVMSLRGVNFGFWSCLGCSGQSVNILRRQGNTEETKHEETQNYTKRNRSQIFLRFMTMLLKATFR